MRLIALWIVGIAVALTLWVANPAHAYSYAGQHDADQPLVLDLVSRATDFWSGRVGPGACASRPDQEPLVLEALSLMDDDGIDAWGRGDGSTCTIWLSRDLVITLLEPIDFDDAVAACQAVYHEVGHARGLPHSRSGLMAGRGPWGDPDHEPFPLAWAPMYCLRWARASVIQLYRGYGESERSLRRMRRAISRELMARRHASM